MKFREHRGSLDDSMKTLVEVKDREELMAHLVRILEPWPTAPPVTAETVKIEPYIYDYRLGWDSYIVTLKDYGVLGFTDGPA